MRKKRKILLYIVCIFVCILLLLLGWFIHKQWNNITAFVDAVRYSQDEVSQRLEENKANLQNILDENEDVTVRDLTEEEAAALKEGNLSEEEVVKLLTGQTETEAPAPPVLSAGQKPTQTPAPAQAQKTSGQVIAEAIARLYVQKNIFLGKLDDIEAYVIHLYDNVMTDEEKKTAKNDLLEIHLPEVAAWEAECDSKVYAIIDEIRAELKKSGQPQTLADEIETAYLNEKRLKKSYFINRYMD